MIEGRKERRKEQIFYHNVKDSLLERVSDVPSLGFQIIFRVEVWNLSLQSLPDSLPHIDLGLHLSVHHPFLFGLPNHHVESSLFWKTWALCFIYTCVFCLQAQRFCSWDCRSPLFVQSCAVFCFSSSIFMPGEMYSHHSDGRSNTG